MTKARIYADFHNADSLGRLRLNCAGTLHDLAAQQIQLREGLALALYSDDVDEQGKLDHLLVEGIASFSPEENCWVAAIEWNQIRHESDAGSLGNGVNLNVNPSQREKQPTLS